MQSLLRHIEFQVYTVFHACSAETIRMAGADHLGCHIWTLNARMTSISTRPSDDTFLS